ncbi:hydrolase, NUDIX family protein [Trichomonas vaginalis G3]|uniref:Hydrolase, NUDIX family protein n=1 Tax=Trichomonas vaginalis (strain ATCC PRA-98 / G3) TaxID=412133 RepID=A2EGL9_TRIV3|nr:NUDIX domain-containing protein [Trichomonas vaginalis G3]EAY08214.1 hydrolase, NUDIX family protein [Trichomonas vaginalis G3]KAI5519743.1 NUDIX domain-containing protein [Trichomonas vaginalis G3]|eukprot:XP_001320437.1 hydrolase, NUDIX family protein [Trichomonas vaginalis G3]
MTSKEANAAVRKIIESFKPLCEQEEQDKVTTLKYLDLFDNVLIRDNTFAHFSSSSFIFNKDRTKTLFIYHNIYDSWTWTGGHNDGDPDFLHVAIKEAKEETGVDVKVISKDPIALDILPVWGHVKRGQWVSSHQHINLTYIFEADDSQELFVKPDENSGVKWVPVEDVCKVSNERDMYPVYNKIIERAQKML